MRLGHLYFCCAALVATSWALGARGEEPPIAAPADAAAFGASDEELARRLQPLPPKSPQAALATFQVIPDFHLELAAHEPAVHSPVAGAFDEEGRLYVAEMVDYPFRPRPGEKPLGCVRLLEDRDEDGRYETSTLFADELLWPTGIVCWRQGIFVAAAPHVYYLKDSDGDGRADVREIVITGFGLQDEQGSVNNLAWGLDQKIYASTSKNGGRIRLATRDGHPQPREYAIRGRDFRYDPERHELELVTGGGQFGNAFDDWGNRFLCDESDPSIHVVLPDEYVRRNPELKAASLTHDLCPGVTPIFRASPLEAWRVIRSSRRLASHERSDRSSGASHDVLDGVAGPAIYRGHAFPPELRGNLIVGDAQNNVVHRRRLEPEGVSFRSLRADERTEFIRSTDNWFRPVNMLNAPDGTLYALDMSREIIESVHVPLDVWKHLDLTRGRDQGRIYRIAPDGFRPAPRPRLAQADTAQLVALLAHPGGWWRDTAQRLLWERQDPTCVAPVRALLRQSPAPLARLHALYVLAGQGALAEADLTVALADAEPRLREHALRLAEPQLGRSAPLRQRAIALATDESIRVRMQAAFSLGAGDTAAAEVVAALADILARDPQDRWITTAVLSSSTACAGPLLWQLASRGDFRHAAPHSACWSHLAQLAAHEGNHDQVLDELSQRGELLADWTVAAQIVRGVAHARLAAKETGDVLATRPAIAALIEQAHRHALDAQSPLADRLLAIDLLATRPLAASSASWGSLLDAKQPEAVQRAAIVALASYDDPAAAAELIELWPRCTPLARDAIVRALLSRSAWLDPLLAALEASRISPNQVSRNDRALLVAHVDSAIRARAEQIWQAASGARSEVIGQYQACLELPADAARGEKIYDRECSACHQSGDKGFAVGPNLALVRNRTPEEFLIHILDPNREVQAAYLQFVVVDDRGGLHSGLIAADTASHLTLRRERLIEEQLAKSEIGEIASTDKSLMPDGFEKTIAPAEMADLLRFLVTRQYHVGTQPGRNEPAAR